MTKGQPSIAGSVATRDPDQQLDLDYAAGRKRGPGVWGPFWSYEQCSRQCGVELEEPDLTKWPENVTPVEGKRAFWLPSGWGQGLKTTKGGKPLKVYVNPDGKIYYHKMDIETAVETKLPEREQKEAEEDMDVHTSIPTWPGGTWLPKEWFLCYKQLPNRLHKCYVTPDQSGYCYHKSAVLDFLNGRSDKLTSVNKRMKKGGDVEPAPVARPAKRAARHAIHDQQQQGDDIVERRAEEQKLAEDEAVHRDEPAREDERPLADEGLRQPEEMEISSHQCQADHRLVNGPEAMDSSNQQLGQEMAHLELQTREGEREELQQQQHVVEAGAVSAVPTLLHAEPELKMEVENRDPELKEVAHASSFMDSEPVLGDVVAYGGGVEAAVPVAGELLTGAAQWM